jgi:hypothetical protein
MNTNTPPKIPRQHIDISRIKLVGIHGMKIGGEVVQMIFADPSDAITFAQRADADAERRQDRNYSGRRRREDRENGHDEGISQMTLRSPTITVNADIAVVLRIHGFPERA